MNIIDRIHDVRILAEEEGGGRRRRRREVGPRLLFDSTDSVAYSTA